ncbi:MAG: hypothetical protein ACU0B5_00810 [Roseovarius sp.]
MSVVYSAQPRREQVLAARARRARAWAWPVRLALLACLGIAIWQEPRLAPWVHARMQEAAAYAGAAIEGAPGPGTFLAGMGGGSSSSGSGGGLSGWFIDAVMR